MAVTIKQPTGGGSSKNIPIFNNDKVQFLSVEEKNEAFISVFSQKCHMWNQTVDKNTGECWVRQNL